MKFIALTFALIGAILIVLGVLGKMPWYLNWIYSLGFIVGWFIKSGVFVVGITILFLELKDQRHGLKD